MIAMLGTSVALAVSCSMGQNGPLAADFLDDDVHAHGVNGIPTTAGAPDFGQQPLIPADPAAAGKRIPLNLLYTSDIHSRVDPFPTEFYHHTYAGKGGYARLATLSRQLRQQSPNTLLLDSGDYLQGSPFFNFFKGQVELQAMNKIQYDAITIGNHEFDNGVAPLRNALSFFKGPIIASNVTFSPNIGQRYAILKAGPLRVGVFGLLTEVNGLITPPAFQTAKYYDPVKVAQAAVAQLRKEADIIVCISHVGIVAPWAETEPEALEDATPKTPRVTDERIAQLVPGIDVILSGHTHAQLQRALTIKNGEGSTLIVAPGYGGGFLGQLSLTVQDGRVVAQTNKLHPLDQKVPLAGDVESLIAPFRAKMDQTVQRRIGSAVAAFGRYGAQDTESGLNNLIADSSLTAARKIDPAVAFGMSSSGTPRNFILQGPITVEDAYYALPFDNKLVIVGAKGQTVLDILSVQRRTSDNKRHAIGNASYTLDRATGKISNVIIDGKPFDPSRTYKIAVNDYMADGASGFTMLPALKRQNTQVLQRDALIAHIETVKTMIPEVGRIKVIGR
ncbi:MAG: bifunctional metallophosphatase/5'-nucleotidase [Candidatus Sericytochromatia bacterium]|nr:bifunctional metallophosphatase/5'-nucleotidase [Candidatus Sericytochromatia bacterium]